eukprot:3607240-Prymnesium_polylepis.1
MVVLALRRRRDVIALRIRAAQGFVCAGGMATNAVAKLELDRTSDVGRCKPNGRLDGCVLRDGSVTGHWSHGISFAPVSSTNRIHAGWSS